VRSLFSADTFTGFGASRLHPDEFAPVVHQIRGRREKRLRKGVQEECAKLPGVYGMLDSQGSLIYVGKAKVLRARLMSYFRPNSRNEKAGRILQHTRSIVWESTPNEFSALVRELELIRKFRPRFNVLGQPGRERFIYICLGRAPAPYAYVSREPTGKELAFFGPLRGRGMANDAVRKLNDAFRLRDCSQKQQFHFSDQKELFLIDRSPGCLRYEIATCSGPCVSGCSRKEYGEQVQGVRAFLDGTKLELLDQIRSEMLQASMNLQFERALALREKYDLLRWLVDRLTWLRQARDEQSFIYPASDSDGRVIWYMIHRGKVQAAVYEPRTARYRKRVRELIGKVFRDLPEVGTRIPAPQVDAVLLVSSWLRKHPEEREKLLTQAQALERVG
jgi:excinuclease ABC subunit C